MANKYKAKRKASQTGQHSLNKSTGIQKEPPLIGKGRILISLVLGTALAAGLYIAAMKAELAAVFYAYWIITTVLICGFIFLNQRREYLYAKMTAKGEPTEEQKAEDRRRRKHIKYLLLVLMPFLFTVIGDTVYLVLIKDSGFAEALTSLFANK